MFSERKTILLAGLVAACFSSVTYAAKQDTEGHAHERLKQAPMPRERQTLPPSVEQQQFNLPPTTKPRYDLMPRTSTQRMQAMAATPACKDLSLIHI